MRCWEEGAGGPSTRPAAPVTWVACISQGELSSQQNKTSVLGLGKFRMKVTRHSLLLLRILLEAGKRLGEGFPVPASSRTMLKAKSLVDLEVPGSRGRGRSLWQPRPLWPAASPALRQVGDRTHMLSTRRLPVLPSTPSSGSAS